MEKKQVKVGYWTYEEFCKKFPDFDKIPVCDNSFRYPSQDHIEFKA